MDLNAPPYDMMPDPIFTVDVGDNRLHVIELSEDLLHPPLRGRDIQLLGFLGFTSKTGNIKDVLAADAIKKGLEVGRWKGGDRIVVPTSGNTGVSFAYRAAEHNMTVDAIVSSVVPEGKCRPLLRRGARVVREAEIIAAYGLDKRATSAEIAKRYAEETGGKLFDQYNDWLNPQAYREPAAQIWEKTGGCLRFACPVLGSTGLLVGAGGYFLEQDPLFQNVACKPYLGDIIDGSRDGNRLKQTGFGWEKYVVKRDDRLDSETADGYCRRLHDKHIPAGRSGGASVATACHFLSERFEAGTLEKLRNRKGTIVGLCILADTRYPYGR